MPVQDDDRSSNYGFGFFVGFLIGTAIGAAFGILIAPKSGAESGPTCAKLRNGAPRLFARRGLHASRVRV